MSAQALNHLQGGVIKNSGALEATGLVSDGGRIVLAASDSISHSGSINVDAATNSAGKGGTATLIASLDNADSVTTVSGSISARGGDLGGDGGFVETSGSHLKIADSARVTTAAAHGLSGSWLLDPNDFTIAASGGDITGAALTDALLTSHVTIQTTATTASCTGATCATGTAGNGDIIVNDAVSWAAHLLKLDAWRNINIKAAMTATSTASLALYYGQGAVAASNTSTITTSGGVVNLPAGTTNFTTKQGSDGVVKAYTVITSLGAATDATGGAATLQGMAATANLTTNYVLGANIDATSTSTWNTGAGFKPIGVYDYTYVNQYVHSLISSPYSGTFDGLGHTITSPTVHPVLTGSYCATGLFGYVTGAVRNVGIVGGFVTGGIYTGSLIGANSGIVTNSYSTSTVSQSTGSGQGIGGLVGYLVQGSISNSYATGAVTVSNTGVSASTGGLVGWSGQGTTSISNSYATGDVTVTATSTNTGGLVGKNGTGGSITNSYATGAVIGATNVGGLVGNNNGGTISNSYFTTGTVTGTGDVGGFVGLLDGGTVSINSSITQSYTSATTSGGAGLDVGGFVGKINSATSIITKSYATGAVSGGNFLGGFVGVMNSGSIQDSYSASATVTGGSATYMGGFAGYRLLAGTISNSFWDTHSMSAGFGSGSTALTGATGLGTAGMQTRSNFTGAGWDFATTPIWTITSGNYPQLCAFTTCSLTTPVYLRLIAGSSYYGDTPSLTYGFYTTAGGNTTIDPSPSGTVTWSTPLSASSAANTYAERYVSGITVGNAYSLSVGSDVNWIINPRPLNLTVSKNYDNSASFNSGWVLVGMVNGNSAPTVSGSASVSSATAGTYTSFSASTLALNNGNYTLAGGTTSATINKKPLDVTVSKTYDGNANFTTGFTLSGNVVGGEALPTLTGAAAVSSPNATTYSSFASSTLGITSTNYTLTGGTTSATISKAHLTVTAADQTRTYGASNPTFSETLSGFIPGETLATSGVTGSATGSNGATPTSAVGSTTKTASSTGLSASNYDFPTLVNGTLTISQATATVSANRAYDGSTTLANSTLSVSGVNGETLSLSGSASAASKNVTDNASNYISSFGGITLGNGSGSASNYQLPATNRSANNSVTISAAPLSVSGTTVASSKTYDGNTTATLSGGTLSGTVYAGDTVALIQSGNFASKDVSDAIVVTAANGVSNSNYYLTAQPGNMTASIMARELTVSGLSGTSRAYNGSTIDALSGTAVLSGLVSGESLSVGGASSGTLSSANAGSRSVRTALSIDDNGAYLASNYSLTQPTLADVTITPKALTVSGLASTSRVYDGSAVDALTGTAVLSGLVAGESLTVGGTSSGTLSSANAGVRSVTAAVTIADSGTSLASNYSVTQPTLADATISQRPITVTALDQSRSYGSANPSSGAVAVTKGSLASTDAIGTATVSTPAGATATAKAGTTYALTPSNQGFSVGAASNYIISYVDGKLTITPAPLTVTAGSVSKVYGQTPTLSAFTSSGLQNGETIGSVTQTSAGSAASASVTGSPYAVTPSAATGGSFNAGNYTISYVNGSLTVTPAPLTVTASNASKTYDGHAYSGGNGVTYSGLVNNEGASVLGGTLGFAGSSQGATNVGSFTITPQGLTSGNYTLSFVEGKLTINKAHLTVTADDASRIVGQANPVFTATLSGFVNNETPGTAGVSGSAVLSAAADLTTPVGTTPIVVKQGSLAAGNYDFSNFKDGTLTINAA
ncbi:MAG: MBG domain-containing protein [Burkholderiales bacterium]